MIESAFVDTNIFVYVRDASAREKHSIAFALVNSLWKKRAGRTSIQVLNELIVTLTKKLKPGLALTQAWSEINDLLSWDPVASDRLLLERAYQIHHSHGFSWWDSLVVAAAIRQGCGYLFTEDLKDGQVIDRLRIVNPLLPVNRPVVSQYTE